jgi:hypothetical protein
VRDATIVTHSAGALFVPKLLDQKPREVVLIAPPRPNPVPKYALLQWRFIHSPHETMPKYSPDFLKQVWYYAHLPQIARGNGVKIAQTVMDQKVPLRLAVMSHDSYFPLDAKYRADLRAAKIQPIVIGDEKYPSGHSIEGARRADWVLKQIF